jgi:hypothetical protein
VEIGDNLFCDKTEVNNIHYVQYLYWLSKIYGNKSSEYQLALPDTLVWQRLKGDYYIFLEAYLRHPAYRGYPVVGISKLQAENFSQWRSDRVTEWYFIKKGVFKYEEATSKEMVFTIEKYFTGRYRGLPPNKKYMYYFSYCLPDTNTLRKIYKINQDELIQKFKNKCEVVYSVRCVENIKNKTIAHPYSFEPTQITYCESCHHQIMTHLKGNVRELTNISGISFGGSFMDSCSTVTNKLFFDDNSPSVNTGFRNICRIKRWE